MHPIARKYLEKRAFTVKQASAADTVRQLASSYPTTYDFLGDPGMYGMYSNFTPESQYISAVAPSLLSNALMGGIGGLGASYALTGMQGLGNLKLPAPFRTTAMLGGAVLGGGYGLGKSTAQYLGGKVMPLGN